MNRKFLKNKLDCIEQKLCSIDGSLDAPAPSASLPAGLATLAEQIVQSGLLTTLNGNVVSLLNNLIASQDIEILLVRDTGAGDIVVQQIREYDQGTGVWTTRYEDVSGSIYVPTAGGANLEYLDPSAVLNLMLTELTSIEANTARGRLERLVNEADDLQKTFTYLDAGTSDERVSTIVYSGTTVPATANVTKTFVYAGSSGAYRVSTITLS